MNRSIGRTKADASGSSAGGDFSRRRFLGRGLTAGAAASLLLNTSKSALGQEGTPEGVLRCGVIGVGDQGNALIESSKSLVKVVRFVAIADIWERNRITTARRIQANGIGAGDTGKVCATYEDAETMLREEDLDVVIIATPPSFHHRYAVMALEQGLDVYCEKPIAHTAEQAKGMVDAQRRTGNLLQIGHQRRSNPRYVHARDKLVRGEGLLGWVTHAQGQWNRSVMSSLPRALPPVRDAIAEEVLTRNGFSAGSQGAYEHRNWRYFGQFGPGLTGDLASHQIDVFNWFFGSPPISVQASGGADYFTDSFLRSVSAKRVQDAIAKTRSTKRQALLQAELEALGKIKSHSDPDMADNVMAIFDYQTPRQLWDTEACGGNLLRSRVEYKALTTTGSGKFYEKFMGEKGSLEISELSQFGQLSPEPGSRERWEKAAQAEPTLLGRVEDAPHYNLPDHVQLKERPHTPHLRNFFETAQKRGTQDDLNCPALEGYKTLVSVLKMQEAITARKTLSISSREFSI